MLKTIKLSKRRCQDKFGIYTVFKLARKRAVHLRLFKNMALDCGHDFITGRPFRQVKAGINGVEFEKIAVGFSGGWAGAAVAGAVKAVDALFGAVRQVPARGDALGQSWPSGISRTSAGIS